MTCACGEPLPEPPKVYMRCGKCRRFYCIARLVLDCTRNTMGTK